MLNKGQLEAVETTEGLVRVIAGAGTGKTRALTSRFAYLIENKGIKAHRILSVTFTNKAANEMKKRIKSMVSEDIETPYIMTFHGFCNRFLRSEIEFMGFSRFYKILDVEDQLSMMKNVYSFLGITDKEYPIRKILDDIIGDGCKTGSRHIISDYEKILDDFSALELKKMMDVEINIYKKIIYGYLREQKLNKCLDYNDLLNLTVYLLKTRSSCRELWEKAFDYVQVDEFQDVSLKEVELIGYLTGSTHNLFVVGDDSQTIYSWRGSDIKCILQLDDVMARIYGTTVPMKTIMLTENYRSTPEILEISNELIKNNTVKLDKELVTRNESGARVLYYHGRNMYVEAAWVAETISDMKEHFDGLSDFAVLYRGNTQSRVLEEALMEKGIPYEILSGTSFYGRKEVKDVLAMLSIVAFGDNVSFLRATKNFPLGLGPKKIEMLREYAKDGSTYYQELEKHENENGIKSKKGSWFISFIRDLRDMAESRPIYEIIDKICNTFELEELYAKRKETERWENLMELKEGCRRYEMKSGNDVDISDYLNMVSLYTTSDKEEIADCVNLMTIHTAKGLEYPVVFIVGMVEGIIPSSRCNTKAGIEEERRVAYVAMTRAKKFLFLTDSGGQNYDCVMRYPSRFLREIPWDRLETKGHVDEYLFEGTQRIIDKAEFLVDDREDIICKFVDNSDIVVGDVVYHDVFGSGVVVKLLEGAYAVMFESEGFKGIKKGSNKLSKVKSVSTMH